MYWNLVVDELAPCGHELDSALQTHFMGEAGSCGNYYRVGEQIPELEGFTGPLPSGDMLIGECDTCGVVYDVGAEVDHGRITKLTEWKVATFA